MKGMLIGYLIGCGMIAIMLGQTRLSLNSQVSPLPALTVTSLYFCASPCTGLGYITLKDSSTGNLTPYVLVPPGTTVVFNPAQWQSVPVTLGKGTGVTCGQVKP